MSTMILQLWDYVTFLPHDKATLINRGERVLGAELKGVIVEYSIKAQMYQIVYIHPAGCMPVHYWVKDEEILHVHSRSKISAQNLQEFWNTKNPAEYI